MRDFEFKATALPSRTLRVEALPADYDVLVAQQTLVLREFMRKNPLERSRQGLSESQLQSADLLALAGGMSAARLREVIDPLLVDAVLMGSAIRPRDMYELEERDAREQALVAAICREASRAGLMFYSEPQLSDEDSINSDEHVSVLSRGEFVEVALKSWADYFYVGVQPRSTVLKHEATIERLEAQPLALLWQQRMASIAAQIGASIGNQEGVEALLNGVEVPLSAGAREQLEKKCRSSWDSMSMASVFRGVEEMAVAAVEAGTGQDFCEDFGFAVEDFLSNRAFIRQVGMLVADLRCLPALVKAAYGREFEKFDATVLRGVFRVTQDVVELCGGGGFSPVHVPITPTLEGNEALFKMNLVQARAIAGMKPHRYEYNRGVLAMLGHEELIQAHEIAVKTLDAYNAQQDCDPVQLKEQMKVCEGCWMPLQSLIDKAEILLSRQVAFDR